MKKAVVIIGLGEMGGVFARGLLKIGHPVYPVGRGTDLKKASEEVADPLAVVVAVGEKDLPMALDALPHIWKDHLVLLQNELLPKDWEAHRIKSPTVISVWFEKKPGQDVKVLVPSPIHGPQAGLIKEALIAIHIDSVILPNERSLLFELVVKNVYILTVNICGLKVGGTVGELWGRHQKLARAVAGDIMDIQFRLVEQELDRERLIEAMVRAFNGDLDHKCMGRSAPARLERAVKQADEFGLKAEHLRAIAEEKADARK